MGLATFAALFLNANHVHAEAVCAQVKIEIKQELTLERQAFDAMMRINNALDTLSIDDVEIQIQFEDENGDAVLATSNPNDTRAKFFIRIDSMDGIADISGNGRVLPGTSAEIHWLIIPSPGAAEDAPTGKLYFVGAILDYTLGGEPEHVEVTPDFITVKPLPKLTLDYFLTREVKADDPFTTQIEPIEPYTLGVRIRNNGAAPAQNVKIDSAQPRIIENEQGLLIGFRIIGSSVNDQPAAPVLLIDFGTINANASKVGRWLMTSTLSGEFVDFTAKFSHADELGGAVTSILQAANTHFLVRDVRVDLPGRDAVRDFLALDGNTLRVYESDSVDTAVTDQSAQATFALTNQSGTEVYHTLNTPVTAGFMYVKLADPYEGERVIKEVMRSDGKRISADNAWTSRTRNRNTNPPSWDYFINFFDVNTTGTYVVHMGAQELGPLPPVLQFIPNRTTAEGTQVGFVVEASDPNGQVPVLSAAPLPAGASFVDNGDGTAFFNWTPAPGQAGTYTITFMASDGVLATSQAATIKVNSVADTDGDGMDDAWELEHFGTLDRDGSGDFDGDGVSDLQEYLDGTDPTMGTGPQAPVIESPLYDAEVTQRQPVLVIKNNPPNPGVTRTYDFEVYADPAMTELVAGAQAIAEGQETTAWAVPVQLNDNTAYTWRVRAFDGHIYSLWTNGAFFVNTANDAPGPFTVSSPETGTKVDTVNPSLTVTNSLDVDRDVLTYTFEVFADAALTSLVASITDIPAGAAGTTRANINTPLSENTLYYWRATALDEHGAQTPGPVANFFVSTVNDAPGLPGISAPAEGSAITSAFTDLVVTNAQDADGDTLVYLFELDKVNTFDGPDKQTSAAIPAGATTTHWPVADLAEDTRYHWRVKAFDGNAESAWVQASFIVNTVNGAPAIPTIQNPGDQAWVATLLPILSVNPAIDPDGDTVSYRFELYAEADLSTLIADHLTEDTSWALQTPLLNNQWYYWRVRTEDPFGEVSGWSAVSSFFVDDNGINDTPTIVLVEPAADVEMTSGGVVTLRWTDEDPDSSATIALYYDTNNTGADGTLIAKDIPEDADGAGDMYAWTVTTVPTGSYSIYAVIDDGNTSTVAYAPGTVTIRNTEIIFDNREASVARHGEWTALSVGSGYHGSDYEYHGAYGPAPEALVVDNSDAAFTALGDWSSSSAVPGYLGTDYLHHAADTNPLGETIIDNRDAAFSVTGEWPALSRGFGYYNTDYQYHAPNDGATGTIIDNADADTEVIGNWPAVTTAAGYQSNFQYRQAGSGSNRFTWRANIPASGSYRVYARWVADSNRASNAPYTITHDGGSTTVPANQRQSGGVWNLLGTFSFTQGVHAVSLSDQADGYVVADAIKIVAVDAPPSSATWTFNAPASKRYHVYGRWVAGSNRADNAPYTIAHDGGSTAVPANQKQNGGLWNLLGTFNFTQGLSYAVTVSDQANGYVIADAVRFVPEETAANTAIWTFNAPASKHYRVYARWTADSDRAGNAPYSVAHDGGSTTRIVDQKRNGGVWNLLGTFRYTQGMAYPISLTDQADGQVIADAISISPVDAPPNRFIWNLGIPASGRYEVYARWVSGSNRASNMSYLTTHDGGSTAVPVNQKQNGGLWNLLGTFDFTQGMPYSVTITDQANGYVIADAIRLVPVIPAPQPVRSLPSNAILIDTNNRAGPR